MTFVNNEKSTNIYNPLLLTPHDYINILELIHSGDCKNALSIVKSNPQCIPKIFKTVMKDIDCSIPNDNYGNALEFAIQLIELDPSALKSTMETDENFLSIALRLGQCESRTKLVRYLIFFGKFSFDSPNFKLYQKTIENILIAQKKAKFASYELLKIHKINGNLFSSLPFEMIRKIASNMFHHIISYKL